MTRDRTQVVYEQGSDLIRARTTDGSPTARTSVRGCGYGGTPGLWLLDEGRSAITHGHRRAGATGGDIAQWGACRFELDTGSISSPLNVGSELLQRPGNRVSLSERQGGGLIVWDAKELHEVGPEGSVLRRVELPSMSPACDLAPGPATMVCAYWAKPWELSGSGLRVWSLALDTTTPTERTIRFAPSLVPPDDSMLDAHRVMLDANGIHLALWSSQGMTMIDLVSSSVVWNEPNISVGALDFDPSGTEVLIVTVDQLGQPTGVQRRSWQGAVTYERPLRPLRRPASIFWDTPRSYWLQSDCRLRRIDLPD